MSHLWWLISFPKLNFYFKNSHLTLVALILNFSYYFLFNVLGWHLGVQFYNPSSAHCTVHSPPQAKSPSSPFMTPFTPFSLPHTLTSRQPPHSCPCPRVLPLFFFALSLHPHPAVSQPFIYESVLNLLVSLFCSPDSTIFFLIFSKG